MPKDKDKKTMKKVGKALLATSPAGKLPAITKMAKEKRKKLTEKKKKELLEDDKVLQEHYEKMLSLQEKVQKQRDIEKEKPRLGNNPEGYKNGGKVKRDQFNGPKAKRNKKYKKKINV